MPVMQQMCFRMRCCYCYGCYGYELFYQNRKFTCLFLWTAWRLEERVDSCVVRHLMGNPISEYEDHIVVWTLKGFLAENTGWFPLAHPDRRHPDTVVS